MQHELESALLTAHPDVSSELYRFIANETGSLLPTLRKYVYNFGLATNPKVLSEVAEDLLHNVVVEALEHADRFEAGRVPKAWLLGIAVNLLRQQRDRQYRQRQQALERLPEAVLFNQLSEAGPEDAALSQLQAEQMIGLVSQEYQLVLRLAFVEGLNGEMLATRLGVKPSTARSKLHRALNQLKIAWLALGEEKYNG